MRNNPILTIIIAIAAVFGIYIYWKKHKDDVPQVAYPHGGSTVPSNFDANGLAKALHDAMSAIGVWTIISAGWSNDLSKDTTKKELVWQKLLNQNNETIIAVYNVFNKKYAAEGKGTLTKWLADQKYYNQITGTRNRLLSKLKSLNLK